MDGGEGRDGDTRAGRVVMMENSNIDVNGG